MSSNQKAYQLFASFKNQYYTDSTADPQKTNTDVLELDDEMKALLQKINKQSKKSSATRLKALQQLCDTLRVKDEGYIESFLKVFTIVFEKIITCEEDPKVLLEAHRCMREVLSKGEGLMRRKFGQVFHYLYFSCFEQGQELNRFARDNLGMMLKSDEKIAKSAFVLRDRVLTFLMNVVKDPEAFIANMSIYEDKEVNKITYSKLAGMAWFCLADMVEKSSLLEQADRSALLGQLGKATLDPDSCLALNTMTVYKEDNVLKTAVLHFVSLMLGTQAEIDKAIVKKVVQLVLLNHLDDPSASFQSVLWKNGFVLKLLEMGRAFSLNNEVILRRFGNLVDHHCYGVGSSYYEWLERCVWFMVRGESQQSGEGLFQRVVVSHFKAGVKDSVRFDVHQHFATGFAMVKTALTESVVSSEVESKGRKQRFECMSPEFVVGHVLSPLNEVFLQENNPLQKNLNVLSVNLAKFYPIGLAEFLRQLGRESFGAKERAMGCLIESLKSHCDALFTHSLHDNKTMVNYALLLKQLLSLVGTDDCSGLTASQLVARAVDNAFKAWVSGTATLGDDNFQLEYAKLSNTESFLRELCSNDYEQLTTPLWSGCPTFKESSAVFLSSVTAGLVSMVLQHGIQRQLMRSESVEMFTELFCSFSKLFVTRLDWDCLLAQLTDYCNTRVLEIKSRKGWRTIAMWVLDREGLAQACNTLSETGEDFRDFAHKVDNLKAGKGRTVPFHMMESPKFGEFFGCLLDLSFGKAVCQLLLPVLVFLEQGSSATRQQYMTYLLGYVNSGKAVDLGTPSLIRLTLALHSLSFFDQPQVQAVLESLLDSWGTLDSESVDSLCRRAEDIFSLTSCPNIQSFLRQTVLRATSSAPNESHFTLLLKRLSPFFNARLLPDGIPSFESFLGRHFVSYFASFDPSNYHTTDCFRVIKRALTRTDFDKLVVRVVDEQLVQQPLNQPFWTHLLSQPCLIHNYSANKQKKMWTGIVNKVVLGRAQALAVSDGDKFRAFQGFLLHKGKANSSLFVFVKELFSQLLSDHSVPESVQRTVARGVVEQFDGLSSEPTQQDLFAFKGLLFALPLKAFLDPQSLCQSLKTKQSTSSRTLQVLFALKTALLDPQNDALDVLGLSQCQHDLSQMGKALQLQVEALSLRLQSAPDDMFVSTLLLDFVDFSLERHEESPVATHSQLLEGLFTRSLAMAQDDFRVPFSQHCFHSFLMVIRKLIHVLELFSDAFKQQVFRSIVQFSIRFSLGLKDHRTAKAEWWTVAPDEFLNEVAETISRFSLREEALVGVDELMELLEVDVNALKKSSFFLIQSFRQPFAMSAAQLAEVEAAEDKASAILFRVPKKVGQLLSGTADDHGMTFLLKWAYVLQSCNSQSEEARLNLRVLQCLFSDEKAYFGRVVGRVFGYLDAKGLSGRALEDQVAKLDFVHPETHWADVTTDEVKEAFAVHLFYLTTYMFPKSLRLWLETDKRHGAAALSLLKAHVNEAICAKELEKIELTSPQWKSDTFDIFFNKGTKEIFAVYFKDDTKFEIALTLPNNFPLKPIAVSVSNKQKVGAAREKQWKLLITKKLTVQNNNIIDALVFWKESMDAEFEKIEPCSICYYILHPTSSSRPKMACKTCKKLLHSECVKQWFTSSQKSDCPLCKSQFM